MTFDPAQCTGFEWDAGNLAKSVTKHGVSPEEAEQVFAQRPLLVQADVKHSQIEPRLCAWGRTDGGRLLSVIFTRRGERIRVISARPMSRKERSVYAQQS
jgi:uncharacterized protein